ncbi:MAG TPA: hypothetical protein PK821_07795 [Victivallales bacterium]|nr:hypothetical protein [Victivallales bacterium]
MKKNKNSKKNESGQALAEFVICLIGILIVFSGMLMMTELGVAKVENVISARKSADVNSFSLSGSVYGMPIRTWDVGDDEVQFSEDDNPIGPTDEDSTNFPTPFLHPASEELVFIDAAELTGATETKTIEVESSSI